MDHTQHTKPSNPTPRHPTPPAGGVPADLLARLSAAGVSLDDLTQAGLVRAEETPARSLSGQMTRALVELERDRPGSYKTWSPYLRILVDGLPDLCPCACETCSTGPCPCRSGSHAPDCLPPSDEDLDCADRYAGAGSRDIDAVVRSDISDLAWWTRRRALKRTVARNLKRARAGRTLHQTDGRGAAESAIQGTRWLFGWLMDNDLTDKNPALKLTLPARQERPARSLEVGEPLEVYRTAVTTGQDPELDGLLLRHQIIHAVRRGGLLDLEAHGVNPQDLTLTYWDRKRATHRTRPSTRNHVAHLIAHMLERGPRVPAPPDAPATIRRSGVPHIQETDPVFYRRPVDTFDDNGFLLHREVRPVTAKHVETLFDRIKRHLPWAARQGLRPHDLRHTSARLVYRAADEQMARLHLAHDARSTTDHYLTEQMQALAKLKEALFGDGLPPADDVRDDVGGGGTQS